MLACEYSSWKKTPPDRWFVHSVTSTW